MGSNQFSSYSSRSGCGRGPNNSEPVLNFSSSSIYTEDNLKTFKIIEIQIGINSLLDNDSLLETNYAPNGVDISAPPLINFSHGISGALPDVDELEKNYVHCFCFLEAEELEDSSEGIFIEFGEYAYGNNENDFNAETFYASKLGGLRFYVVKKRYFEDYCQLVRIKCEINKNESLDDILVGIQRDYKWKKDNYDRKNQNSIDFVTVLLKYLELLDFEICKGTRNEIPDKILDALDNR